MKKFLKNKIDIKVLLSSWAITGLMATVVYANPAMLPDHPGHPMKALKDPVNGQSLANDPGRDLWTGQEALEAAAKADNKDMKLQSRASLLEEAEETLDQGKKPEETK